MLPSHSVGRRLVWAATTALFLVISLTDIVLWHERRFQVMAVADNGALPALHRNDAVVVRSVGWRTFKVSDMVSYHNPIRAGTVSIRRVEAIDHSKSLVYITANRETGGEQALSPTEIIGRVTYAVRRAGYVVDFIRSPAGLVIGTYIPAAYIVALEIHRLCCFYAKPAYRYTGLATVRR